MERDKIFMGVMVAAVIFLSVTLYLGVTDEQQTPRGNWSVSLGNYSANSHSGMYVDAYGTFYTVTGSSIYAIDSNGAMRWILPIKSNWLSNHSSFSLRTAVYQDRILYVVVGPEQGVKYDERSLLMAIADDGKLLWEAPIDGFYNMQLAISGEYIYLRCSPDTLLAFDMQGMLIWSKNINEYFPSATGSGGMIYLTNSSDYYDSDPAHSPSAVLEAYYPNGTLYWSHPFTDYGIEAWLSYNTLGVGSVLYHDGTIYIMDFEGVIAVNENGSLRWAKDYGQQWVQLAGLDSSGRLYLYADHYRDDAVNTMVITPDGMESNVTLKGSNFYNYSLEGFSDGIGYYVTKYYPEQNKDQLKNFTMRAYDMASGDMLWEYTITPVHVRKATLNSSNVADILFTWNDLTETRQINWIAPWVWYDSKKLPNGSHSIKGQFLTGLAVTGSTVYFSYWAYSYEFPAFYGMSNCTYAGGLYAIDGNGKLLWYKDTDSYITSMTARNGTIYYQINGGRFSASGADITAGFAAAAIYLFFRFFLLGAVSRARSRLDKNANRNAVLAFLSNNPGASLYDITRGLGLNVGTVRYHLFILSINHKVSTTGNSPKSVRYFAGNRQYSGEEKLLMSLVRREQIKKLLSLIAYRPGLSNAEIARELGLAESAVSRHMIELCRKGVVEKRRSVNGKLTYCLDEKYRSTMSDMIADSQISYTGNQRLCEPLLAEASK